MAQETIAPITTALAVEPPASSTTSIASPPLFGRLPLPRMRPSKAPRPPEVNSPQDVCDTLAASAHQHRLPIAFFGNLIYQESGMKPRVISRAGARGIAQFMPGTAREVGLKDPFNPRQALPASAKFLRGLLHRFGNNYGLAAAAYNAGPGRVSRWLKRGGVLPHETRNYVVTITGKRADQWRGARGNSFAHNLTGRIPCSNLKAFAELENNPASAHSLRPVRFVLPMPLPNPLRLVQQASLKSEAAEPQMTVNIEMKLPTPRASEPSAEQPANVPTASIAVVLPPPQMAPRRVEQVTTEPRSDNPVSMVANSPALQVTMLEPIQTTVARIKNPPTPRPNPLRQSDETGSIEPITMAAAEPLIKNAPLPRANPRRLGEDIVEASKLDSKLPLPRARPLHLAQAAKKK
jgi:hypothetical protein